MFIQYALEMLNVSQTSSSKKQLEDLCSKTIDNSQDFTDSVYISIEQRDKVLEYHQKLQDQLAEITAITANSNELSSALTVNPLPAAIQSIQHTGHDFRKHVSGGDLFDMRSKVLPCDLQLEQMAIFRSSEFFRTHDESVLLNELKTYSLTSRFDLLQEAIDRFREQAEIAIEVRLL